MFQLFYFPKYFCEHWLAKNAIQWVDHGIVNVVVNFLLVSKTSNLNEISFFLLHQRPYELSSQHSIFFALFNHADYFSNFGDLFVGQSLLEAFSNLLAFQIEVKLVIAFVDAVVWMGFDYISE